MAFLNYVRNQWDRVAAWVCIGLGAIALLIGWLGVSSHEFPAEQNSYIASGGLLGLFLLGLGGLLWLSADLRDEWRKLDAIERALKGEDAVPVDGGAPSATNGSGPAVDLVDPSGIDEADSSTRRRTRSRSA